jgi:regulator of protease activity HflC (stomatin/prohibitin superfamily)
LPPAAKSRKGAALPSSIGKYPAKPPALPLRGTTDAQLRNLQQWRVEITAARGEHSAALAARFATMAAKTAAKVALKSVTAQEVIASRCVEEADARFRTAWNNYINLYGHASTSGGGPSSISVTSGDEGGDGTSSSEEGAAGDDGEEEVVSAALGEDAESHKGDMDLS